jgi:hypothetical protein
MQTAVRAASQDAVTAADVRLSELSNDSLIVRLHFTINHLSRWITPIHDRTRLERSMHRGEPSVRELLISLRTEELRVFPMLHLIATQNNPDLDRLPDVVSDPGRAARDAALTSLSVMAEFRRLRQSTCSLLRSLPDNAWSRFGTSRREHDWQVRQLAEHLASHDLDVLYQIDLTLDRVGARDAVSPASRVHLDELLRLVPVTLRSS